MFHTQGEGRRGGCSWQVCAEYVHSCITGAGEQVPACPVEAACIHLNQWASRLPRVELLNKRVRTAGQRLQTKENCWRNETLGGHKILLLGSVSFPCS